MNYPTSPSVGRRINVLTLDGGGVRGLSSLLILDELMRQINDSIRNLSHSSDIHSNLLPNHIFDLVAGTSTGGLISLMLGKLGMNVKDCIEEYRKFSKEIFKRKQLLAMGGFARSKYSGSKLESYIRNLVKRRRAKENLSMRFNETDKIACAVVCREYKNESLKPKAVCICSLPCSDTERLVCLVYQAALATSAAPTYFPVQNIADRSFVDGGLQFNNPSHAIFQHYGRSILVEESQMGSAAESGPHTPSHGELNFTKVRIINLGTGTKADPPSGRPSFMTKIMPGARNATFLTTTFKEIVVDTENVVDVMTSIAKVKGGCPDIKYERFSADNGVGNIKMDAYKHLEEIERLTLVYLEIPQVKEKLKRVGEGIAREYLDARATESRPESLTEEDQVSRLQPSEVQSSGVQSSDAQLSVVQPSEMPQTPKQQQQRDHPLSLHTQSSNGTFWTRSGSSKLGTLNGSPSRTSVEPSPVPSERLSTSLLNGSSGEKSSQNGNKESDVDLF